MDSPSTKTSTTQTIAEIREWLGDRLSTAPAVREPPKSKEQKRLEAEARNARSRAKKDAEQRVAKIESELSALDKRKQEIVELLQDQATYADAIKFRDLSAELEAVEPKIAKLTTEWEKAAEEVEKLVAI